MRDLFSCDLAWAPAGFPGRGKARKGVCIFMNPPDTLLSRHTLLGRALLYSAAIVTLLAPSAALAAGTDDPFESANRTGYAINQTLDRTLFGKAGGLFKHIPLFIRAGIHNILVNLTEPGVAANDLLQGHPGTAAGSVVRFVVNSTVGIGGAIDVTGKTGLPHHSNSFADTFGRYGAPPGPYLFIPLVGPTDVRDMAGSFADTLTDPFTWSRFYHRWTVIDARTLIGGLDQRVDADDQLKAIDNMSTDTYASLRSLYLQNRAVTIASPPGAPVDTVAPPLADFGDAAPPAPDGAPAPPPPATNTPSNPVEGSPLK
jgi:phospholipid-binding lipoprotein MlaA